jgi:hypothetical protein
MNDLQFAPAFASSSSSNGEPQKNFFKKVADRYKHIFAFTSFSDAANFTPSNSSSSASSKRKWRGGMKKSMYLPIAIVIIFLVFAIFMIGNALRNSDGTPKSLAGNSNDKVDIKKAKSVEELNKTFSFGIKDSAGVEVSKLKFIIQNVELRDEIVVKGQKATSVKGRTFLVVNMKITSSYSKPVQINSRDYLRLMVNNSDEKLAPDIHNDPVEIQAISTKYTRVGFPINETDKNLTLQVGEIAGPKETIKLNLK